MINTPSPLEGLAAFAICFAAGVLSTAGLSAYTAWIKRRSQQARET